MLSSITQNIKKHLINIPGWRTDRKIVVFESDDWGMIRMKSQDALRDFISKGYEVKNCPYNSNDSIESNEDMLKLFEVLCSVQDSKRNYAKFTANNIVANPNFEKIRQSDFCEYHYESFTETLQRYPDRDRVLALYKEGIKKEIFKPQFHGREHLNVHRWMRQLNSKEKHLVDAFDHQMFTVHRNGRINGRRDNLDAFGSEIYRGENSLQEIIYSGLDLFESIWGFHSKSFIAPCYVWPTEIEGYLAEKGVRFIQGTHVQRIPLKNESLSIKKKRHWLGQKNIHNQFYLIRNAFFEPTEYGPESSIKKVLQEIDLAFRLKKPAIISTHRVNYTGSINKKNRDINLKMLRKLLKTVVGKFPEVEFMFSDELGYLISNED